MGDAADPYSYKYYYCHSLALTSLKMIKRLRLLGIVLAFALALFAVPAQALDKLVPSAIPKVFESLSNSKFLADPSMILVDTMTGEVVFERNSTQARKPASVIKLLSTTSVLSYIDAQKSFNTNIKFTSHTKSKRHQAWLVELNQNKLNYYEENIKLNDTVLQQRKIIAELEKKVKTKELTIEYLTQQLHSKFPPKPIVPIQNLIDLN